MYNVRSEHDKNLYAAALEFTLPLHHHHPTIAVLPASVVQCVVRQREPV